MKDPEMEIPNPRRRRRRRRGSRSTSTGWVVGRRRSTRAARQCDRMQDPSGRQINLNGISQHLLFLPFLFYLLLPFHSYLLLFFLFISLPLSLAADPAPQLTLSESRKRAGVNLPLGITPKCLCFFFLLLSFQHVTSISQGHQRC